MPLTSKIVPLPTEANEDYQAQLTAAREVLEMVEAGRIRSFVVAAVTDDGRTMSILPASITGPTTLLGAVALLQADLVDAIRR